MRGCKRAQRDFKSAQRYVRKGVRRFFNAEARLSSGRRRSRSWKRDASPGNSGVLYRCERKGVAGKGICKCVEIKDLQIDQGGRGICKCMKTKERRKWGARWWVVSSGSECEYTRSCC